MATAEEIGKHGQAAEGIEPVESLPADADLCLVLGGDGSILHALRNFAGTEVPVLGVNFGTVGFLAAVERDRAEEGLRRALAGETETVELPALASTSPASSASPSTTSASAAAPATASPS